MTLPTPLHTSLAEHTDVYIKDLAYAIDARLGGVIAMGMVPAGSTYTTQGDGLFNVTVPGLGQLYGALLLAAFKTANGAVANMPPVPPASIGRAIPATAISLTVQTLGVGYAQVRAMTTPWDNGVYQGQTQQYGSQAVNAGVTLGVYGLAWGAKA